MKIFDLHADTMLDVANHAAKGETDILAKHHLPSYKEGDVGGLIYALFVPALHEDGADYFVGNYSTPQDLMMKTLARSFKEFHETKAVTIARNADDIDRISDEGGIPIVLGIEGFYGFNGEPGMIDMMYDLGFRHGMLTWNNDNEFAAGAEFTGEDKGLTELGVYTVKRMEELGMLVDVSHASFRTFWDIMDATTGPIIASHSNSWTLCPVPRNLKDDQIRAIASRGGVIGMNGWKGFIKPDMETANVDSLAEHARYIADLVGPEYVACGFDFADYFNPADNLPGLGDASQCQNFVEALRRVGFSESEIEGIAWNNTMRVIREVLK